ncbi:MAG: DUF547 domain-containing protein [Pseudomonadota bacterium]
MALSARKTAATFVGAVTAGLMALTAPGAPSYALDEAELQKFAAYDAENSQTIGYGEVNAFLNGYGIPEDGRFKLHYSAMRNGGTALLAEFVSFMSQLEPTKLSRDEQLAYWLNLHNLMVVRAIASENVGRDLEDERGEGPAPGEMWTQNRVTVEGVELSIDDIQSIVITNWNDPNVLYGLYQGVQGGPRLRAAAYYGASVMEKLEDMGRKYVNARGVTRVRRGEARVSPIYHWHKDTLFGGEDAAVIAHVKGLAKERLASQLEEAETLGQTKFSYRLDKYEPRRQPSPGVSGGGGLGGGGFGS